MTEFCFFQKQISCLKSNTVHQRKPKQKRKQEKEGESMWGWKWSFEQSQVRRTINQPGFPRLGAEAISCSPER